MKLKTIPEFPVYYIDKNGGVYSTKSKRFLKPWLCGKRFYVRLYKNTKHHCKLISRLVLETFVGPCPINMECCHNNGISTDNKLNNLRWDTRKNNVGDAIKHGTHICLHQNGEANLMAKLKEKDVRMIIYMFRTGLFLQKEIAKIYNVDCKTISGITNKKTWKHVWSISNYPLNNMRIKDINTPTVEAITK